ncbi:hypothetical protein [Vitiosangium sp. GDMCC 1.1324]|uniref:hypothetical protein n=1 Tax=Vitiosangium sp. (strain GDMCC 1.1324) TaxID=2138576 RepID=UPI000D378E20|nr:hypothetical protein [Vitiosangium sp. GDMCC 1.1324]PTL76778.1 hypothetical protein DAT35_48510 [Vitiosangium sp. GDMCC 1.1324]
MSAQDLSSQTPGTPVDAPRPRNILRAPARWLVADTRHSLDTNHRITRGYIQLAHEMQALVDPDFRPGGVSRVLGNWFAFAPHAALVVGKGMLGAHLARAIIDAAQGEPAPSIQHALERGGVSGSDRLVAEKVADTLRWFGLSHDVAASLGTLLSGANLDALADPRPLWLTTWRFARLLHEAPGFTPLERAEAVARTLEQLLLDGNVAIYSDIGGAAHQYLEWRKRSGGNAVKPAQVVEGFALEGTDPDEARRAWVYALEHVKDSPRPSDFASALPDVSGKSLLVTAFALYEDARQAASAADRDALIAFANNYVAWHEQHNAVQPAFSPPSPLAGEVPRLALMLALTPTVRLELGPIAWELTDYTATQKDRDHNFLTSKPTEYNWAFFEDRWPAILTAFELGYRHREELWAMPRPLIPSLDLIEAG